jgi:hypothetical protein
MSAKAFLSKNDASPTIDVIHTPTHDIADNIPTVKLYYGEAYAEVPKSLPFTDSPLDAYRGRGLPGVHEIRSIVESREDDEEKCPCKSEECNTDEEDRMIKKALLVLQESHIAISRILGEDDKLWARFREVVVRLDDPDSTVAGVLFSTAKKNKC